MEKRLWARGLLQPVTARGPLLAGCGVAMALGVLASLAVQGSGLLYDNDAYYHLAIARLYADAGFVDDLEAVRFSLLHEGFGDKELLFHVLLVPFVGGDAVAGGRLALALLHGLLAAAASGIALRIAGWSGLLLPFWLPYASTELAWRLVRLRPELLSLLLLLVGVWAMGRGRYRLLGLVTLLYTLSYTAFHAFVGLALLFCVLRWVRRRRFEPAAALYPLLGAGLGLLVHPHFPKNLQVWLVQNVQFFVAKGSLDVGTEIRPNFTDVVLMVNLGWILALLCLWQSSAPRAEGESGARVVDDGLADALGLASSVFGVLYLFMSRFVLYVVPLASLWLLAELQRRGRRLEPWTRVPLAGRIPAVVTLAACLVVSFPEARRQLLTFRARTAAGPEALRIADRAAVGRVLPAGARIAAPWRQTPIYMLWAPQGRYLNVLDPIFMAAPYPEQHLAWDRVWNGVEPDVPLALAGVLDSEYLAYSIARRDDPLLDRLVADPRIETLYRRFNAVFRVVPGRNGGFVLDWRLAPPGRDSEGPVPAATDVAAWPKVPRFEDPRAQALEGYVDLTRRMPAAAGGGAEAVGAEAAEAARQATRGCQVLVHDLPSGGTGRRQAFGHRFPSGGEGAPVPAGRFELAPSGPTVLWLDGDLLVAVETDLDAVLGRGLTFELPPRSESGRLTIRTCPSVRGEMGLYLLRRG